MNLMSLKEKLLELGQKVGLQVQEETKDFVSLHSQLTAKDYCRQLVLLLVLLLLWVLSLSDILPGVSIQIPVLKEWSLLP